MPEAQHIVSWMGPALRMPTAVWLKQRHLQDASLIVRPRKPQPGKMGRKVQVFANHFPVKCSINEISHYDVEIKAKARPEGEGTRRKVAEKPLPTDLLRYDWTTMLCQLLHQYHSLDPDLRARDKQRLIQD